MINNGKVNVESQLQVAIGTLLSSVTDKSILVLETVKSSLRKLSEKHPNQVLESCCQFCTKNPKPSPEHIASILIIMEAVCSDHILKIDGDTIIRVIDISLSIMTENVSYDPLIQMPSCGILVALGREHYVQVMDSLCGKIQSGVLPHFMVPHTFGAMASTNANGIILYLKDILAIMIPLLGGLRSDILKQSFGFALGNFCDALMEYVSNNEKVPDPTISLENFNIEFGMVYDVLFTTWLFSREPKVTQSTLDVISSIFPVLNLDKVTQQTSKLIQVLLNLYKKNIDPYNITKCLGSVIQKAASVNGTLLEPLLMNILNTIFDLICVSPDYAQPGLLKSHSEVLRCYECFALHFTDNTIDQLLIQLKNNNEKERVKSLIVLTHLVSYSKDHSINRRFKDVIRYLRELLSDNHIRVKEALVKIIVAFSCKKVLLDKEVNPDGPEKYMEFILKMCCKQVLPKNSDVDLQELQNIQKSTDNTLYMLSTSVAELEVILWDLLLKCFLSPAYDDAIVIILRCLTHLASKKEKVESCETAFIRCLSLLSNPLPNFRGCYILNFLKNIKPCKVDAYKAVWDVKIPQLLKYLEQNYEHFNTTEWQDLLFDFLNILLETTNNGPFNEVIVSKATSQLDVYNNSRYMGNGNGELQMKQIEKHFLLKCLSIALCYLKDKEIVLQTLDNILVNVKLTDYSELHTCAEAVGICSRSHLQIVLDKLALIRKEVLNKKTLKFFTFIKDQKHDLGVERLRYTILYSYSEICNEAPSDKLLKVIESEILDYAVNELVNSKDFSMRKVCLRTIHSVADAMHPNRNLLHIRMNDRDKVIKLVSSQTQLHSGPEYIELFPTIIPTITALVRLPLPIESEDRIKLIKLFFDNVFNASAIYCKINTGNPDSYYGDLKLVPSVTKSFTELNQLVQELLLQSLSPATLDEIVTLLEPWLGKKRAEQRLPAAETLRLILQGYLENMKFAYESPTSFGQTGSLLAKVVPRCTDPNKNIRKVAVECMCLILCIASRYEGHMREHDKVLSNSLQHIQQQIDSDDPKLLYNLTSDLAHIVCLNLSPFQLIHCVEGLLDALLDCESSSSNGSSVVLNTILKNKGGELQSHVTPVLEKLLKQLYKIQCMRTKSSSYRGILNLAMHHSRTVCGILLTQPLPLDSSICECWSIISTDSTLAHDIVDQLKKHIKSTPLYEDQADAELKLANLQPLQAICALHELLKNVQLKDICLQQFSELFSILLVCMVSYMGVVAPAVKKSEKKDKYGFSFNRDAYKVVPAKIAAETFRLFLVCCEFEKMEKSLLAITNTDSFEDINLFIEVIRGLVDSICVEHPQSLSWLVACLGPYIRADLEPQRVATVAFFTHFLQQGSNEQTVLTENLLEMILDVQGDQSCLVRKLGLQGLGYAAEHLSYDLVSRHCNPILSVLMNSLDYNNISNEGAVILEGMSSFSKLLNAMTGCKFSSFQVTAAVRIKPLLDQEDVNLRRASFHLLGDLTQSLHSEANLEAFREQIHGNLITLMLHLCDPDIHVVKACKYTLRRIGPYLESPRVNSMIQEHLIDEANLHFTDFIRDFIKVMSDELQDLFPLLLMTCLSYFKSQWTDIKGNAALIAGLLFSLMVPENKARVSLDTVCDRLIRLLTDESEVVRIKAVEAISYLFLD
nr:maestro heat-like repeat-containing protein family member 1 [Leptinotarsa decemlineata]